MSVMSSPAIIVPRLRYCFRTLQQLQPPPHMPLPQPLTFAALAILSGLPSPLFLYNIFFVKEKYNRKRERESKGGGGGRDEAVQDIEGEADSK